MKPPRWAADLHLEHRSLVHTAAEIERRVGCSGQAVFDCAQLRVAHDQNSWVYVAALCRWSDGRPIAVKIGFTATSPWARWRVLHRRKHGALVPVASVIGTRTDERRLLDHTDELRIRGEWRKPAALLTVQHPSPSELVGPLGRLLSATRLFAAQGPLSTELASETRRMVRRNGERNSRKKAL